MKQAISPEPTIEDLLGDVDAFINKVHTSLCDHGLNALQRNYEMDHVCYRCESVTIYQNLLHQLVPKFGVILVEGMIGGRPISTVKLHQPLCHLVEGQGLYEVTCVEVPCPKAGSHYSNGLEHAELVIGHVEDGIRDNKRLKQFIEECKNLELELASRFDYRALNKKLNADVSVSFDNFTVKFHQRPLYEVCAEEMKDNEVVPVPDGYFEAALLSQRQEQPGMLSSSVAQYSRHLIASTKQQLDSIAEKKQCIRYCLYSYLTLDNRQPYFGISCRPITVKAEDDMELLSDLITVGELYTSHFQAGRYDCAQCRTPLFSSNDKWQGPCVWPSFRKGIDDSVALSISLVSDYNAYDCKVGEVYCSSCNLFVGHCFEDGIEKGDTHSDAQWRF